MAYTDFTFDDLETKFGIKNRSQPLFKKIVPVQPTHTLLQSLENAAELPIRSEKAKSETIVFPILLELRNTNDKYFTIYSGDSLNASVDDGLKGECDFILAKDTQSFSINYPIIQIVEAKKNDIEAGVPQCAAQLLGAKIFNEKKNIQLDTIYGCVTTGDEWLFMKIQNKEIIIDTQKYYLVEINKILGAFQYIIDYYKNLSF
jgi:hypothetical protein